MMDDKGLPACQSQLDGTIPTPATPTTPAPSALGCKVPAQKSLLRRFIPPTLERKHSSGDLQSRLKTRKILGVGETDNGDIHRSKISQVLGHNEHLYMKMPKGYWTWHTFLILTLTLQALTIFTFPNTATDLGFLGYGQNSSDKPVIRRYYAAAILGFSFVLWKLLYLNDKTVMRVIQYGSGIFFASHLFVDFLQILENGFPIFFESMIVLMILARIGLCTGCIIFWKRIGAATSGLRKSPSYKDLDDGNSKGKRD